MELPNVDLTPWLDRLWVTSDTHFGHANIVGYTHRPFSADDQDQILFQRWRQTVRPADPVLHLGDLAIDTRPDIWDEIAKLPGNPRWLVRGNHDKAHRLHGIHVAGFRVIRPPSFLYQGWVVECTHQPIPPEDLPQRTLNVHGHVHDKTELAPDPRQINVCVEQTDYRPVRLGPLLRQRLTSLSKSTASKPPPSQPAA